MKAFKTILIFTACLVIVFSSIAQNNKPKTNEVHKIVIQFNDMDSVSQVRSVMQVENILNVWPDAQVVLVCLGGGLDLLTTKSSKVKSLISDWTLKGVVFAACNNSMNVRNIKKENLLPEAVVVPAGVIEIARKQAEGWSYFRGGK
jgi:intracellular sulfur oxidation DsrE/DsrF family protein